MSAILIANRYDRGALSLRQMGCILGPISEANGSCRYTIGETVVIASIYGPGQPKYMRHEDHECLTIDVSFSTSLGGGSGGAGFGASGGVSDAVASILQSDTAAPSTEQQRFERMGSKTIQETMLNCIDRERFPRQLLQIKIAVLHNGGSVLAAAMTACTMALLHAGIPMFYVPVACTVAVTVAAAETARVKAQGQATTQGEILLDPTDKEENSSLSLHTWVFRCSAATATATEDSSTSSQLLHGSSTGVFTTTELQSCQSVCEAGCEQILRFIRGCITSM